jgi:hypothetical protein
MLRRLLHVAALLSLLMAGLLFLMTFNQLPRIPRWIGDPTGDGWAVGIAIGRVVVIHVRNRAVLSVPFTASLQSLSIPFALFPLVWFAAVVSRQRRDSRLQGFPVEVSSCSTSPTRSESKP